MGAPTWWPGWRPPAPGNAPREKIGGIDGYGRVSHKNLGLFDDNHPFRDKSLRSVSVVGPRATHKPAVISSTGRPSQLLRVPPLESVPQGGFPVERHRPAGTGGSIARSNVQGVIDDVASNQQRRRSHFSSADRTKARPVGRYGERRGSDWLTFHTNEKRELAELGDPRRKAELAHARVRVCREFEARKRRSGARLQKRLGNGPRYMRNRGEYERGAAKQSNQHTRSRRRSLGDIYENTHPDRYCVPAPGYSYEAEDVQHGGGTRWMGIEAAATEEEDRRKEGRLLAQLQAMRIAHAPVPYHQPPPALWEPPPMPPPPLQRHASPWLTRNTAEAADLVRDSFGLCSSFMSTYPLASKSALSFQCRRIATD